MRSSFLRDLLLLPMDVEGGEEGGDGKGAGAGSDPGVLLRGQEASLRDGEGDARGWLLVSVLFFAWPSSPLPLARRCR